MPSLRTTSSRASPGQNGTMTGTPAVPMLSAAEQQAAEAVLAAAWGERAEVRAAEPLWDRAATYSGCAPGRAGRPC
jgi:hypothetical protein